MRLEAIPIILGTVVMLLGLALIADGLIPDGAIVPVERRRAPRAPRNGVGQALFGAAMVSLAASLLGGDEWRFTTLAVILALVLAAAGVALNWPYLRSMTEAQVSLQQQVSEPEVVVDRVAAIEPEMSEVELPDGDAEPGARSPEPSTRHPSSPPSSPPSAPSQQF